MTAPHPGQQEVCPAPEPAPLLRSARYAALFAEPGSYAPRKLKGHQGCEECIWALHERAGRGPAPLPVLHRRTSASGSVDICHPHKLAAVLADRKAGHPAKKR